MVSFKGSLSRREEVFFQEHEDQEHTLWHKNQYLEIIIKIY